MTPHEEHIVKQIRRIDENIQAAEDRIAHDQILIGNFRKERQALYDSLSPDAKKTLEPAAPDASQISSQSTPQDGKSSSTSTKEKPK